MSNSTDYQAKIEEIKAIKTKDVKEPHIRMDSFLQEAEDLYHWSIEDVEKLTASGLNQKLVVELPIRTGACREAQSLWIKERNKGKSLEKEWKKKSRHAYDLKDLLLHTYTYAFRKDENLLNRVNKIRQGNSHADMIQDLSDLSVLGKANTDVLISINFDIGLLDKSDVVAAQMASLLAKVNSDRRQKNEIKIIRDKAHTYLKEAMTEIRVCGKYVFWKDKDRLKGYTSQYNKRKKKRTNTTNNDKKNDES